MIPFLPSGSDAETLESTFRKLTNKKREQVSLTIARKIGYPKLILPKDVRNDLYVNVYYAELSRLSKTADRNVEVVVEAVDE